MNDARNGNSVDGLPAKGEFVKNEAKDEGGLIQYDAVGDTSTK